MKLIKITLEDSWYIAYYFGMPVVKQKTLKKCLKKLKKHLKEVK
jgi:hypothetical protein